MSISFDFTGKSVLVTGASSGIGQGVAAAFANAGADLTILSSTDSIHDAATAMHGNVKAIKCDISDTYAVTAALADIERVDVLINNAGLEKPTPLSGTNPSGDATFERVIAINVNGTRNVTDTLINRIPDGGRIIITSSIWAKTAVGGFSAYVASKHANVGRMRTCSSHSRRVTLKTCRSLCSSRSTFCTCVSFARRICWPCTPSCNVAGFRSPKGRPSHLCCSIDTCLR